MNRLFIVLGCLGVGIMCRASDNPEKGIYQPEEYCWRTESPKHTFVIECYRLRPGHQWVVRQTGDKVEAVLLPELKHSIKEFVPSTYTYDISPDEE